MYLDHFALRAFPFSLTADTAFLFEDGDHEDALDVLDYALSTGECFAAVTGEAGTGKTLVCRAFLESAAAPFDTIHLRGLYPDAAALLDAVSCGLGLTRHGTGGEDVLLERVRRALLSSHDEGKRAVLVVDEAQALPDVCFEVLRRLSDLECGARKVLQIVLFGASSLDDRFSRGPLRPVGQRMAYRCTLKPLSREASGRYVRHRLDVAGGRDTLFAPRAVRTIHRAGGGVPRLMNILSHKALLAAFGRGDRVIGSRHVRRAIGDTDGVVTGPWRARMTGGPLRSASSAAPAFVHGGASR